MHATIPKTAIRVQVLFEKLAAVNWFNVLFQNPHELRIQTYFSLTVSENICLF